MEKLSGESLDIRKESVEKLKQLFPEIKTDGKIDFEKLKQILGNELETDKERYNFTWNGKQEALRNSQTPSTGTLRPCKEESKNFDETQNLYIEGDNLEVLKLLQKSYFEKVKMIYIDPPYNTGNDFVYKDDFKDNLKNYKEITGQVDNEGNHYSTNTESNGRYHSDWLNMMYPRLRLARNLLKEDGVIFISLDDNEIYNMKKICDEVFGEDNFITNICHKARASVSNDKIISSNHNLILLYAKNERIVFQNRRKFGLKPNLEGFDKTDKKGKYKYTPVDGPGGARKGNPYYVFEGVEGYFRYSKETMQNKFEKGLIVKVGESLQQKYYLEDAKKTKKTATSWWDENFYTSTATSRLKKMMEGDYFSNPKNVDLIIRMLVLASDEKSIVLDFFSGSGTTAHAVMKLNAEDGGNRKYICVQLPEETDEKSEAFKAGYKNICEIGKERIRRAGKQILEELKENKDLFSENGSKLDVGFKVLKLDSSNIKKWNSENKIDELDLFKYVNNIEEGRTQEDILYEIILKMGLELTYPIEEIKVSGKNIYTIGFGALMICIDDNVTIEVAERMVKEYKEQNPETWKVVFMDNSFKDDAEKINIIETLKCAGLDEDNFVTI